MTVARDTHTTADSTELPFDLRRGQWRHSALITQANWYLANPEDGSVLHAVGDLSRNDLERIMGGLKPRECFLIIPATVTTPPHLLLDYTVAHLTQLATIVVVKGEIYQIDLLNEHPDREDGSIMDFLDSIPAKWLHLESLMQMLIERGILAPTSGDGYGD
jgi:hypothetical protein